MSVRDAVRRPVKGAGGEPVETPPANERVSAFEVFTAKGSEPNRAWAEQIAAEERDRQAKMAQQRAARIARMAEATRTAH